MPDIPHRRVDRLVGVPMTDIDRLRAFVESIHKEHASPTHACSDVLEINDQGRVSRCRTARLAVLTEGLLGVVEALNDYYAQEYRCEPLSSLYTTANTVAQDARDALRAERAQREQAEQAWRDLSEAVGREQLMGERPEWYCRRCHVVHGPQGSGIVYHPCPTCRAPMEPSSDLRREHDALRAQLARLDDTEGLARIVNGALAIAQGSGVDAASYIARAIQARVKGE